MDKYDVTWHSWWNKDTESYYARCSEYLGKVDGKYKYRTTYLHKVIKPSNKGELVDHFNHDTLDNNSDNLRITKQKFNLRHRNGKNKNNTTGYRNVSYDKSRDKFIVQLQNDEGINTVYGEFDTPEEANDFAIMKREELYKEFAGV